MNKELENNLRILRAENDFLRQTYAVKKIGVFGSFARGRQGRQSDIDILVEFTEPIGLFKFVELKFFLEKIIGRKVDLATKNALKPIIKKEILQ